MGQEHGQSLCNHVRLALLLRGELTGAGLALPLPCEGGRADRQPEGEPASGAAETGTVYDPAQGRGGGGLRPLLD